MSTKAAHEQVAEFLRTNPASTKEAIGEGTGIKGIVLVNSLKKLRSEESLIEEGEGKEATFSIQEQPVFEQTQVVNEPKDDEEMIRHYRHKNKDWIGTVVVGGKRAREVIKKYNKCEG